MQAPSTLESDRFVAALKLVVERQLGSPAQMPALLELLRLANVIQLPVHKSRFIEFCKKARPIIFIDDGYLASSLFDLISSNVAAHSAATAPFASANSVRVRGRRPFRKHSPAERAYLS